MTLSETDKFVSYIPINYNDGGVIPKDWNSSFCFFVTCPVVCSAHSDQRGLLLPSPDYSTNEDKSGVSPLRYPLLGFPSKDCQSLAVQIKRTKLKVQFHQSWKLSFSFSVISLTQLKLRRNSIKSSFDDIVMNP